LVCFDIGRWAEMVLWLYPTGNVQAIQSDGGQKTCPPYLGASPAGWCGVRLRSSLSYTESVFLLFVYSVVRGSSWIAILGQVQISILKNHPESAAGH
jgi:hypothetical protein